MSDCFMYKQKDGEDYCTGNIIIDICGPLCPFRKTLEEQAKIENDIYDYIIEKRPFLFRPYMSRITGKIIFEAGDNPKKVFRTPRYIDGRFYFGSEAIKWWREEIGS